MGSSVTEMMHEIDVPIRVKGRHEGGFRTAYKCQLTRAPACPGARMIHVETDPKKQTPTKFSRRWCDLPLPGHRHTKAQAFPGQTPGRGSSFRLHNPATGRGKTSTAC